MDEACPESEYQSFQYNTYSPELYYKLVNKRITLGHQLITLPKNRKSGVPRIISIAAWACCARRVRVQKHISSYCQELGYLVLTANTMGLTVKYPETLELGDKRDRRLSCDLRASYTFRVTHWLEGRQPSGTTPVSHNMSKVGSVFKGHHNLGTPCRD